MREQIKDFSRETPHKKDTKFEARENKRRELMAALQKVSNKINEKLGTKLLSDDCSVSMKNYGLPKEELAADKKYIQEHEEIFIREEYELDKSAVISSSMRQEWEDKRSRNLTTLMEMVIPILSYKMTKDYIMKRSAKYDDIRHGADMIFVNIHTGKAVCTVDEVHDTYGVHESGKKKKQLESAKYGGATIKYGFTFENDQLVKKEIKHVPSFYMSLSTEELEKILNTVDLNNLDSANEKEIDIFNNIISNLGGQINTLREASTNNSFLRSLDNFEEILPTLYKTAA